MSEFVSEIGRRAGDRALTKSEVEGVKAEYRVWADGEIARLRSQVEQLQGRCAELEGVMASIRDIAKFPPADKQILKYAEGALSGGNSKARDLRLQAEAVDEFGNVFDRIHRMIASRKVAEDAFDYAQRLRDQAGEIDRGGSDARPD